MGVTWETVPILAPSSASSVVSHIGEAPRPRALVWKAGATRRSAFWRARKQWHRVVVAALVSRPQTSSRPCPQAETRPLRPALVNGGGRSSPSFHRFQNFVGGYRLMSFRLLQGGFSYLFTTGIPGGQTLVMGRLRHPQCAGQTYMLSRGTAAGQKLRAGGVCGRQLPGWRRHTPAWRGHVRTLQYQHFGPVLCELSVALCPMVEE